MFACDHSRRRAGTPAAAQIDTCAGYPCRHRPLEGDRTRELDAVDRRPPGSAGRRTLCQPVQPRRALLRSDPAGAADPGDADPLLRQQRRWPAGAAVQPRHAQDSNRAECGLKIFGIAVGLLILMATVALLSMQITRTVDGQLAIMPSRLT